MIMIPGTARRSGCYLLFVRNGDCWQAPIFKVVRNYRTRLTATNVHIPSNAVAHITFANNKINSCAITISA